jgi:hypothetical protein
MEYLFRTICKSVLLALCLASAVSADSPVWQIEKNGRLLYLGGTLHLLTPQDYPLPDAFETAYQRSLQVVFETDLERLKKPDFQLQLVQQLTFKDGRTLRDVIRPETYAAIAEYFRIRKVPMTEIDQYKPGMVAILMTVFELQRMGVTAVGVDDYYNDRATQENKAKGQLEDIEKQIEFIANMGKGQEDAMLNYSLADVSRLPKLWLAMKLAWRSGDLATLEDLAATPLREQFPKVYHSLLVTRNNAWMSQIETMAASSDVELVLVGALHLAGEDGLLAMLGRRGYRITQMP